MLLVKKQAHQTRSSRSLLKNFLLYIQYKIEKFNPRNFGFIVDLFERNDGGIGKISTKNFCCSRNPPSK